MGTIYQTTSIRITGTENNGQITNFECLAVDVLSLPHDVGTGSTCLVIDTGDIYIFEKTTDQWYEQ